MSYMDRKSILGESFFSKLKNFFKRPKMSAQDKIIMKNPKLKKQYDELMTDLEDFDKNIEAFRKKYL